MGPFDSYVNTWLKIKQESGGWPSWTSEDSDRKRDEYVRKYKEREGIALEKTQIAQNPGRKTTANVEFFLGKFWRTHEQVLSDTMQASSRIVGSPQQSPRRNLDGPHLEYRPLGSVIQENRPRYRHGDQNQHLRGCLHDLSGPSETLRVFRDLGDRLRHTFRHLYLETFAI